MTRTHWVAGCAAAAFATAPVGMALANIDTTSKLVPAALTVRIKAAGLDPGSPAFATNVRARLSSERAALARTRPPAVVRHFPKSAANSSLATLGNATVTGGSAVLAHPAGLGPRSQNRIGTLTFIAAWEMVILGTETTQVALPGSYAIFAGSPSTLPAGPATYTISVPDCGVVVAPTDGAVVRARSFPGTIGMSVPPAIPTGDSLYALSLNGYGPPLAIGAQPHAMIVNYTADGFSLTTSALTVRSAEQDAQAFDVTVDQTGTVISDGGIDLTPDNMVAGQPGVTRFNETDSPMTGTDIVGLNVALGTGYTATAKIVSASSVADPPGNSDPDNQFRGATIAAQPSNGRLQTSVNWHIGPYDSLQYVLEWTLTGPPGQRPALSMPLGGPCDS